MIIEGIANALMNDSHEEASAHQRGLEAGAAAQQKNWDDVTENRLKSLEEK